MSIPHYANGQRLVIEFIVSNGICEIGAYFWHLSHFLT